MVYLQDLHHLVMDEMIKIVSQAESSQSKKTDQVELGGQPAQTCIVLMLVFEIHIAVLSTSQCDRLLLKDADILAHRNLKLNQQVNPKWVAESSLSQASRVGPSLTRPADLDHRH